jgi:predicted RNase H-like nuclease (RuvC/YqgF family)
MALSLSTYGRKHGLEYYGGEGVSPPNPWELHIHSLTHKLYMQTKTNDALEEDIEGAVRTIQALTHSNKILRTRNVSLAKENRELKSRNMELKKAVRVVQVEQGAKRKELERKLSREEKGNDETVHMLESRVKMLGKKLKELKHRLRVCGEDEESEGWEGDDEVNLSLTHFSCSTVLC